MKKVHKQNTISVKNISSSVNETLNYYYNIYHEAYSNNGLLT